MSKKKIKHVGRSAYRLSPDQRNPIEVAFAQQWKRENEFQEVLRVLTCTRFAREGEYGGTFGTVQDCELTQRDAEVAATVIQWLGSNVGFCFLGEALAKCGYKIVRDKDAK